MRAVPVLILALLTSAACGCGQKGPLVLPDKAHPHKKLKFPAAPKPAAPTPSTTPAPPAAQPPEAPAPAGPAPGANGAATLAPRG